MRDLNDLAFFAAVAANGGFSAAARALGVPKSRVSRRVAALEARLGVRLVERSSRRFAITVVAQAALAEADAIDDVAARLKAEPQGLVRVSCPQGADRILAAVLPSFLAERPKLSVQVLVSNRRVDLIEEGIDIAIRVRQRLDTDADLQLRIIGYGRTMLVASPALLDAHGRPQWPHDLARFPTLGLNERPGPDRWTLVDEAGGEETIAHEPRLSSGEFTIIREAAIAGLGVAFLPEYVCREPLEQGRLERVLPQWSAQEGILHLVFTSRRGLLPGVRAVIELLANVLDPENETWRALAVV